MMWLHTLALPRLTQPSTLNGKLERVSHFELSNMKIATMRVDTGSMYRRTQLQLILHGARVECGHRQHVRTDSVTLILHGARVECGHRQRVRTDSVTVDIAWCKG